MVFDAISLLFTAFVTLLALIARVTQQQFSSVKIALTLAYSLNPMSLFQWTIRFAGQQLLEKL